MSMPEPMSIGGEELEAVAPVLALAPPRLHPFAEDSSGLGYFRSDHHHRQLAATIFRHLSDGHALVLTSGDPAVDGELLQQFLDELGEGRCRATLLRCRNGMDFGALVRTYNRRLGLRQEAGSDGIWALLSHLMTELRKGVRRILLIENAETLDPTCFDELLRFTRLDEPHVMPVVLLAAPEFAALLAAPPLGFLQAAITARVAADRLAEEEVGAFIRYQLNALGGEEEALFPVETVYAIAAAAGGSAAAVNHLAREVLARAGHVVEPPRPPLALEAPMAEPAPVPATLSEREGEERALVLSEPLAEKPGALERFAVLRRLRLPPALAFAAYAAVAALSGFTLLYALSPRPAHQPAAIVASPSPQMSRPTARAESTNAGSEQHEKAPPSPATVAEAPLSPAHDQRLAAIEPQAGEQAAQTPPAASTPDAAPARSETPETAPSTATDASAPPPVPAVQPQQQSDAAAAQPAPPEKSPETASPASPVLSAEAEAKTAQPASPAPAAKAEPRSTQASPAPTAEAQSKSAQPASATPAPEAEAKPAQPAATAEAEPKSTQPASPAPERDAEPKSAQPPSPAAAVEPEPKSTQAASSAPDRDVEPKSPQPSSLAAAVEPEPKSAQPNSSPKLAALEPASPPAAARPVAPDPSLAVLVQRGQQLLGAGDVISARQFFERGAAAGDPSALFGLAMSYDPVFLRQIGARGVSGDAATALDWYRRAAAAGSTDAAKRLERLRAHLPVQSTPGDRR